MRQLYFIYLLSISLTSLADNSPVYDFKNGLLSLPFINTQQGTFSAELTVDPHATNPQSTQFRVTKMSPVSIAADGNQTPHFDFDTGLLSIPYVATQQGAYRASLKLSPGTAADQTLRFNLANATAYIAPRSNKIQTCNIFPADNFWNVPINTLSTHSRSSAWINAIGSAKGLHMDFGAGQWNGGTMGIPYNLVKGSGTAKSNVNFEVKEESDVGPYPIPADYKIESGSDRHLLMVDTEGCKLHELYSASNDKGWNAFSGAVWNLNNNQLRPRTYTSADAAGLPIFAGLLRYDEVAGGSINHAIRFTVPSSKSYIWPARHLTGGSEGVLTDTPPLGARFRLKANYDISRFAPDLQVILKAMQTYGVINADNGSGWYISGEPDSRWDDDALKKLEALKGADFEAVETACMMINANSAQADPAKCTGTS